MSACTGRILVGGGTGFIGQNLCTLLKCKGYNVTIISRMPGPQRISWIDLHAEGIPKGTTAVVNLAGQNVMDFKQRWTPGFKQNVYNSRINTTRALAKAIKEAEVKPSVYVTMSGVGVYRPNSDKTYTEDATIENFDFFSELGICWEKAAKAAEAHCRVVTIRSGVVLGRHGGMIKNMYLPFYLGLGGRVGSGKQVLPWIHVNDLTKMILWAIETDSVRGVINGVAPKTATNMDFTKAFARALRRPAFFPVPGFLLNILLNKERASMITKGQTVTPHKVESLGFNFDFPDINSACQNIVASK